MVDVSMHKSTETLCHPPLHDAGCSFHETPSRHGGQSGQLSTAHPADSVPIHESVHDLINEPVDASQPGPGPDGYITRLA